MREIAEFELAIQGGTEKIERLGKTIILSIIQMANRVSL